VGELESTAAWGVVVSRGSALLCSIHQRVIIHCARAGLSSIFTNEMVTEKRGTIVPLIVENS